MGKLDFAASQEISCRFVLFRRHFVLSLVVVDCVSHCTQAIDAESYEHRFIDRVVDPLLGPEQLSPRRNDEAKATTVGRVESKETKDLEALAVAV